MKFGITARLTVVLAAIGIAVSGLTGFYAYNVSRSLLVQSAQGELMTSTQVLARRITQTRQEISRNLMLLAAQPEALTALRTQCTTPNARLALEFRELMRANPAYFQIRLISAADGGPECVRVDRDNQTLVQVLGDDLQEKGHFLYVSEALKLKEGQPYLSQIAINHERGAHAGQEKPTVILSTPVVDAQKKTVGVVAINVDLNGMFSLLAADLPGDYRLYLANRHGDFLIHPDRERTFGFDRGQRVYLQDEFPQAAGVVTGKEPSALLDTQGSSNGSVPLIAAFAGTDVAIPGMEERLVLGLAQPREVVLEEANALGQGVLKIVAAVSLACVALALLVARAITHPINAMSEAVLKFSNDTREMALPTDRQDEIGMLARSFARMQTVIRQQMGDLQDNQEELEHLAQHDVLTDLPNRRRFMDRLDQAIARAHRNEVGFALLFIDVDHFKGFNDRYGHAAGDAVLQAVASRLHHGLRAVDTVARLGGDEFVVLLDQFVHREQIAAFTEKLLTVLKAPIEFQGTVLHAEFSVGISQFPEDGSDADHIIASADRAMYRAKTSGRNGYRFTSDDTTQPSLL